MLVLLYFFKEFYVVNLLIKSIKRFYLIKIYICVISNYNDILLIINKK